MEKQDSMGGLKFDQGKPPMGLLPFEALELVAKVLAFGAEKYEPHNWRKGMKWSRLIDASLRHIGKVVVGEWNDEESGLPHLAHAACDLLFVLAYSVDGKGEDDLFRQQ